ncbi:hypothetical protein D7223_32195 [Micromonospora endolithica]|uniref:Uncharacterized protein n=1 Tax=Micromonospora endolithica TaxID=230091 RepID=A0A3A9YNX0_9ACTN|nr:hypothetical protein D7223_32195 [Micromonospora endolithica]
MTPQTQWTRAVGGAALPAVRVGSVFTGCQGRIREFRRMKRRCARSRVAAPIRGMSVACSRIRTGELVVVEPAVGNAVRAEVLLGLVHHHTGDVGVEVGRSDRGMGNAVA